MQDMIYNGEVVAQEDPMLALEAIISGWIRKRQFDEDLTNYHRLKESYE